MILKPTPAGVSVDGGSLYNTTAATNRCIIVHVGGDITRFACRQSDIYTAWQLVTRAD